MTSIKHAIVRIWDPSGKVAGAGFLVDEAHLVTCTHVLRRAIGGDSSLLESGDISTIATVQVDFPLLTVPSPQLQAKAKFVDRNPDRIVDIAGLTLIDELPCGAKPVQLITADRMWGHKFRTAGFPPGNSDRADWVSGRILDTVDGNDWLQIDAESLVGRRVREGFSGSPIWDESLQGTTGMVMAADKKDGDRVAYVIPATLLVQSWSEVLASRSMPPSPYRGLYDFTEETAEFFFGRERSIESLEGLAKSVKLTILQGPSGSGKSSVVRAGLVPRLTQDHGWLAIRVRPGRDPFTALALAVSRCAGNVKGAPNWLSTPSELVPLLKDNRFSEIADELSRISSRKTILLFVDQFEELATQCKDPDVRDAFLTLISETSEQIDRPRCRIRIILAVRSDYLEQFKNASAILDRAPCLLLEPMNEGELQESVVRPALALGVKFEPELVEQILHDFNNRPGALPMLEFLLTLLWEEQSNRLLTRASYQKLGGVSGALVRYADDVLENLDRHDQVRARRVLVQLIGVADGSTDTRRTLSQPAVRSGDWDTVRQLATSRLLYIQKSDTGEETAELVHESLAWHWPVLNEWIMDSAEKLRVSDARADLLSRRFALGAGAANLLPPPFDTVAVGATFARMGQQMARAYDCSIDREIFRTAGIAMATGILAVAGATWGGTSLLKWIPGLNLWVGLLIQPPIVAAIGFAVANTWKHYFHVVSAGGRGPDNAEISEYVQLTFKGRIREISSSLDLGHRRLSFRRQRKGVVD